MVSRKEKKHHCVLKVLYYGLPEVGYLLLLGVLAIKFLFMNIIFSSLGNNGFLQPSEGCWYHTPKSGHLRELVGGRGRGGGGGGEALPI